MNREKDHQNCLFVADCLDRTASFWSNLYTLLIFLSLIGGILVLTDKLGTGIINWIVGGLNFQVEHHLFPKISHVHYPAISKFVEQTCKEFGIAYHNFPTFTSAVSSHVKHLKYLGTAS